jgi:hypothetical protein
VTRWCSSHRPPNDEFGETPGEILAAIVPNDLTVEAPGRDRDSGPRHRQRSRYSVTSGWSKIWSKTRCCAASSAAN